MKFTEGIMDWGHFGTQTFGFQTPCALVSSNTSLRPPGLAIRAWFGLAKGGGLIQNLHTTPVPAPSPESSKLPDPTFGIFRFSPGLWWGGGVGGADQP